MPKASPRRRLDIVVPAYKPSAGWHTYLIERLGELMHLRPEWDVCLLITDDGSPYGHSFAEIDDLKAFMGGGISYIQEKENRGKGAALRRAVMCATAPYVLYTDWDFPFTTESYLQALDALAMGAEVVLPVRDVAIYRKRLPCLRRLFSIGSNWVNRSFLGLPSHDTQGGIKAFNTRGREVFLQTQIDGFLFDTEFIALATRQGLNIVQTPCYIREGIVMSAMSWRTFSRELKYFKHLFCVRWFS